MNLDVVGNVTNFIKDDGKVVVCGVCLGVAGFEPTDIIDRAIIGTDEITPKILTNITVIIYYLSLNLSLHFLYKISLKL